MELTQDIIEVVEKATPDEDIRQDFYAQWLSLEDTPDMNDKNHLHNYIRQTLWWRRQNQINTEQNHARLIAENEQTIRDLYTDNTEYADDPSDLIEHEQQVQQFVDELSDTNRRTFTSLNLDGLTPEEHAEEEGVARNAIDQRVHNIKKLVKEKFNG